MNKLPLWPFVLMFVLVLTCLALLILGVATGKIPIGVNPSPTAAPVAAPATLPHTTITYEKSTGGLNTRKVTSEGASIALNGDTVNGKDLAIAPTVISLGDLGSITGGAFTGSISASSNSLLWIRILCAGWAVVFFWRAYVKWQLTPADIPHIAGTAAAGIPGVVGMIWPEFALACAAAAAVVFIVPHLAASKSDIKGKAMRTLGKVTRAVENAPSTIRDGIKAEIAKHSVDDTIIEAAKKAEGV